MGETVARAEYRVNWQFLSGKSEKSEYNMFIDTKRLKEKKEDLEKFQCFKNKEEKFEDIVELFK